MDRPKHNPMSKGPHALLLMSHNIYYVKSNNRTRPHKRSCMCLCMCMIQFIDKPIVNNFSTTFGYYEALKAQTIKKRIMS